MPIAQGSNSTHTYRHIHIDTLISHNNNNNNNTNNTSTTRGNPVQFPRNSRIGHNQATEDIFSRKGRSLWKKKRKVTLCFFLDPLTKLNNKSNGTLAGLATEAGDALVKGLADLVQLLLGDLLADGGDLGDDDLAEFLRGGLLLLERRDGLLGGAELVEHRLLGHQVVHGGLGLRRQLLRRRLQAQGVLERELRRGLDGLGRVLDRIQQCARLLEKRDAGLGVLEGLFFWLCCVSLCKVQLIKRSGRAFFLS